MPPDLKISLLGSEKHLAPVLSLSPKRVKEMFEVVAWLASGPVSTMIS